MTKREFLRGLIIGAALVSASRPLWADPTLPGWQNTFNDDFNGTSLNGDLSTNTWSNLPRWGQDNINSEAALYVSSGVSVSGGYLHLTANRLTTPINYKGVNYYYTSGEIQSQGTENGVITATQPFSQLYGRFEIRSKAPSGQSFWPAFWLLPQDVTWPPEIDVYEMPQCGPGFDSSGTTKNVHVGLIMPSASTGGWVSPGNGFDITSFHIYDVEWDSTMIKWLIDGNVVYTTSSIGVPQKAMYMIANLAMGGSASGSWTGPPSSNNSITPCPSELTVDYIRAYSALAPASFSWNKAAGGTWSDLTTNGWNNTAYPQTSVDTANFNQTLTATQTVTLNNALTLVALNLADVSGSYGWNISGGGNTITFDSDNSTVPTLTAGAGTHSVSAAIALPWQVTVAVTGAQLTLSGPISGVGSVTKSGAGVLVLGNATTASTYTGGTILTAGTIKAASSTALGSSQGVLTMSAGSTLDLNGYSVGVGALSGTGTIDNTAAGFSGILTVGNGDASGSFTGVIKNTAGTLALTKLGAGTLTLSGTNTYSGGTTLSAGTLSLSGGSVLGTGAITISGGTLSDNGANETLTTNNVQSWNGSFGAVGSNNTTLNLGTGAITLGASNVGISVGGYTSFYVSGVISGTAKGLTINGPGTTNLAGANTYTAGVTLASGTLQINNNAALGTGTFTINGGSVGGNGHTISNATVIAGSFSIAGASGTLTLAGTTTLSASSSINISNSNLTFSTPIANASGTHNGLTFTYGDYTSQITLAAANTFDGGVTFSPGGNSGQAALMLNNAGALGSGTFTINAPTGNNIGVLKNTSGAAITLSTNNPQIWNGDFTYGYYIWPGTDYNLNMGTGSVSLGATGTATTRTVTVGANGSSPTLTIAGVISDGSNGTTKSLTKAGTGTLTLSAANLFDGTTTVSAGTLNLSNTLAIQYSTLASAGIVFSSTVSSHAFTLGGLSGSSNLILADNAGSPNPVALTVGNNNTATTYSGILSGAGSLIKSGTGVLTLSGTHSYTGTTTVSAGTLLITGALNSQSTAVTVASGATLAGTGTINRPVTFSSGATFGGNANTLTVANSTVTLGSSFNFNWAYPSGTGDQLAITGTGTLATASPTSATVILQPSATDPSGSHTIMTWVNGTPNINWSVNNTINSNPSVINWTGSGDGTTWGTGTNWDLTNYAGGTVAQSGNSYVLSGVSIGHPGVLANYNVTIAPSTATTIAGPTAAITLASLTLGAATGSTNQLNVGTGKITVTGTTTVNATGVLNGASGAANTFSSGSLAINGGTATLGTGATITGNLSLSSGTVTLGSGATVGGTLTAAAGTLNIASGSSATVGTADLTTGTATIVNTQTGSLAITNQLKLANNITATLTGGASFTATGSSLSDNTAARTLTLSGGTLSLVAPVGSGSIGIQFQGGGTAIGSASNGVVSMTNWNTFTGSSLGAQSGSLKNSSGATGVATLSSFSAPGTYQTGSSIPLLNGYLDDYAIPGSEAVTVTNIPYATYSVYAYFGSDGNGRKGSVKLGSTTYYYSTEGTSGETGYYQTTDMTGATNPTSNYAVWSGLTGSTITVNQYYGSYNSGLHGIEIVNTAPGTTLPNTTLAATSTSTLDFANSSSGNTLASLALTAGATTTALTLQNAQSLTLAGDASNNAISVTGTAGQNASILSGANAPILILGSGKAISVAPGTTLTIYPTISSSSALTKIGSGTLIVQNLPGVISVNAGTLKLAAGTNNALETLTTLSVSGTLDLTNHDLLLGGQGANLSTYRGKVTSSTTLSAYKGGTATAALALLTGNEYTIATGLSTLDTVSISPGDLIGKFTYQGDANLDGRITADDYLALDLGQLFGLRGWTHGDFAQTGGSVTIADYALIDNSYQHQSGTLADDQIALHTQWFGSDYTDALNALQAAEVPEPANLALLALGAVCLVKRRR